MLLRYLLERDDGERREVFVELSGTVAATSPDTLPSPLDDIVRTRGRRLIEAGADRIYPVRRIIVHTQGYQVIPEAGAYEPGDRVFVEDDGAWCPARVVDTPASLLAAGEQRVIVSVDAPGTSTGTRESDAVVVEHEHDGSVGVYPYMRVRPLPPEA